ncbi:MAG: sigma-70 family RNA polymerase sigma factor [Burkholderiaceae bacterium]
MDETDRLARSDALTALLARVALGDRRAFEDLYHRTSAQLFGVVLRINSERAQAEEVLQEVFVNIWRAAGSFDAARAQPLTWLTSVARNRAIDSLRRRASEPATVSRFQSLPGDGGGGGEGDDELDLLAALPAGDPGPLELLDRAAQAHQLQQCMESLSGEQRSSLALAYYQGLSHAEVALQMSQPLGTVKSWVRRGLLSLRSCLDRAAGLVANAKGAA